MCALKTIGITERLSDYVDAHTTGVDDIQRRLIEETARLGGLANMQIAPDQGTFLTMLTQLVGARYAVEIGTFTGYSALCITRGMPADGRLLCCDISAEWTGVAKRFWDEAGVTDRIDLRVAPAIDTLRALPSDPVIDMSFIDADKRSYVDYYEELVPRTRPGGLIIADNVLWSGRVVDAAAGDDDTVGIRRFNDRVTADDRVDSVILTIGDGVTIARKHDPS